MCDARWWDGRREGGIEVAVVLTEVMVEALVGEGDATRHIYEFFGGRGRCGRMVMVRDGGGEGGEGGEGAVGGMAAGGNNKSS